MEPNATEPVLSLDGIHKAYPIYATPAQRLRALFAPTQRPKEQFWALRSCSFVARRGECIGIIGRNGSGKSTLLQIIAGTIQPTGGELTRRGRLGAILELGSGFNPEFSGIENIELNAALMGLPAGEFEFHKQRIIAFADIGEFIDRPLRTYSSGMVVRLAFAVSTALSPEILLIDEALAVGDAGFQFKCLQRLRELSDAGTTLLFVSHDISMVKAFCDRALYLRTGELVCDGPTAEVGELYLRDLRDQQNRSATGQALTESAPLNQAVGAAFGNGQAQFKSVQFCGTRTHHETFPCGAPIRFRASLSVFQTVQAPCLAVAILDRRHIAVAGTYHSLSACDGSQAAASYEVEITIPGKLMPGNYFVTLVIEDRPSPNAMVLLEKQAGILSFCVMADNASQNLIGMFDLGLEISESAGRSSDVAII